MRRSQTVRAIAPVGGPRTPPGSATLNAYPCRAPSALAPARRGRPHTSHGRIGGRTMNFVLRHTVALALLAFAGAAAADVAVPAPGTSSRIDAIKKAGVLRVGVLANAPWLVENTTGGGETWSGPAWLLAQEYAKGVRREGAGGPRRPQKNGH